MNEINLPKQVAWSAERLSRFTAAHPEETVSSIKEIEQQNLIPPRFSLFRQVEGISFQFPQIAPHGTYRPVLEFLYHQIAEKPSESPLHTLSEPLQNISNIAGRLVPSQLPLPFPVSAPLPVSRDMDFDLDESLGSPSMADPLEPSESSEEESTEEEDLEPEVELLAAQERQAADNNIICRDYHRMNIVHSLLSDLRALNSPIAQPWIDALGTYDPGFWPLLTALIEGRLEGLPLAELLQGLTKEELPNEMKRLIALGGTNRIANERMLELAILNENKIAHQKTLNPSEMSREALIEQLTLAIKGESEPFIKAVLESPRAFHLLPTDLLNALFFWSATRGFISHLKTIYQSDRAREIQIDLIAMMSAHEYGHSEVFDLIFDRSPPNQRSTLLKLCAGKKIVPALTKLLDNHSFTQKELDEAFKETARKEGCLTPFLPHIGKISQKTLNNVMKDADARGRTRDFDQLFIHFPHHIPSRRQDLLTWFAIQGIGQGLGYLLSKDYPYPFNDLDIQIAFQTTASNSEGCLKPFFEPHTLPKISKQLELAFHTLCDDRKFNDLSLFMREDLLKHIPQYKEALNEAYSKCCSDDMNNPSLKFFYQPEISKLLTDETAHVLVDAISKHLNELSENGEEGNVDWKLPFQQFLDSPLYDRFSQEELEEMILDAAGTFPLALALLESRRGAEISKPGFERLLLICSNPETLLSLLDRYPSYSGEILSSLLQKAVEGNYPEHVLKILSKETVESPIPEPDYSNAFAILAKRGDLTLVRAFCSQEHKPFLPAPQILELIKKNRRKAEILHLLLNLSSTCAISPKALKPIYLVLAEKGDRKILKLPIPATLEYTDADFQTFFFTALKNGHLSFAKEFRENNRFYIGDYEAFQDTVYSAVAKGNLEIVQFLFEAAPHFINSQILEKADEVAQSNYKMGVSIYLWNLFWDTQSVSSEPSHKRQRQ